MQNTQLKTVSPINPYPENFPPSWASEWGEDEFGVYADFAFDALAKILAMRIEVDEIDKGNIDSATADKLLARMDNTPVTQRFRWIAPGEFMMGSPEEERQRFGNREVFHRVNLSQGYWLADTAMTQQLWLQLTGENPAHFKKNKQCPVENVSWEDLQKVLGTLNHHYATFIDKQVFRLPTEAEWEHACRAGTTTPFSFGENITPEQVNYNGGYPYANGKKGQNWRETVAVKSLPANPWGLYEMHGNVWEWCADAWQEDLGSSTALNPYQAGGKGARRVVRGGAWGLNGRRVRSAFRHHCSPGNRLNDLGFRLSLGHELQSR